MIEIFWKAANKNYELIDICLVGTFIQTYWIIFTFYNVSTYYFITTICLATFYLWFVLIACLLNKKSPTLSVITSAKNLSVELVFLILSFITFCGVANMILCIPSCKVVQWHFKHKLFEFSRVLFVGFRKPMRISITTETKVLSVYLAIHHKWALVRKTDILRQILVIGQLFVKSSQNCRLDHLC